VVESSWWHSSGNISPERAQYLLDVYHHTRPEATPDDIAIAITTDNFRMGAIRVAERKVAGGPAPVYMYRFHWESPALGGILKSCHTLEIPFVFNNVEPFGLIGDEPERITLAQTMSATWAAFARNGDPNHKAIPFWPAYTPEKRSTMILNIKCRVENDPDAEERKAWDWLA